MKQIEKTKIFGLAMNEQLEANSHKHGWGDCSISWLLERAEEEFGEFKEAVVNRENVLHEAADVANFLMMICDNIGKLKKKELGKNTNNGGDDDR